jgi:poly(hydroxyalkanoate) granule-associated protein
MENIIEKMLLASLGVLTITKEKTEKIVEEFVKRGEIAKKDKAGYINKLFERGKDARIEIEKIVEKSMTNVLNKLNIPTKSDIDALMKKIEGLKKK